jgi:hypothetical protein
VEDFRTLTSVDWPVDAGLRLSGSQRFSVPQIVGPVLPAASLALPGRLGAPRAGAAYVALNQFRFTVYGSASITILSVCSPAGRATPGTTTVVYV